MVQTRSGRGSTSSEPSLPTEKHRRRSKLKEDIEGRPPREEIDEYAGAEKRKIDKRDSISKEEKEQRNGTRGHGKTEASSSRSHKSDEAPPQKAVKQDVTENEEKGEDKRRDDSTPPENDKGRMTRKIRRTIEEFGSLPLEGTPVAEHLEASPEALLAMCLDVMLKSTRISHDLAQKAVKTVIDAGYHDINVLSKTTWDDRVEVVARGGYNRYRERGASMMGDLIELVNSKYEGDLNNLLKKADYNPRRVWELIKEIKGLGDLATDIFFDNAQAVWPVLAPHVDARSLDTAEEVGIGRDVNAMYEVLNRDPVEMSKLALGLSNARLARRQGAIKQIN
ncbi:hypothetical protein VTN49DRAFT_7723 [Thermomyces lanuginosus]|uniref:uncharacterized protein n=1 Tax=Thermomyces lanuginosus TaxID=5541 RepID=UPI00374467C8